MGTKSLRNQLSALINLWSFRPSPSTPEGQAWIDGAQWAWDQATGDRDYRRRLAHEALQTLTLMTEAHVKQLFLNNIIRHNKREALLKEIAEVVAIVESGIDS